MPELYWNPLSINFLVMVIQVFVIAAFFGHRLLLAVRNGTWLAGPASLFIAFSGAGIAAFCQFLSSTVPTDLVDHVLPWVGPFSTVGMSGSIMFAYLFTRMPGSSRAVGLVLLMFLAAVVGVETAIALARQAELADGFVKYRDNWTDIPFLLCFLLAHIFYFSRITGAIAHQKKTQWLHALWPAAKAVVWPITPIPKEAAASRAFLYNSLLPLGMAVILIFRANGVIDWRLSELASCWVMLVFFAGFVLVYLNYVPEYSSFKIKLVGLTLTGVLTVLSGISWVAGTVYSDAYIDENRLERQTAIRYEPGPEGAYRAMRTGYQFEEAFGDKIDTDTGPLKLRFSFPFFGESYTELFVQKSGMVGLEHFPTWGSVQHRFGPQPAIFVVSADLVELEDPADAGQTGLFVRQEPGRVVLTWNNLVSRYAPQDEYTFQAKLYATGAIELFYAEVPDVPSHDFYWANSVPLMTGIVGAYEGRQTAAIQHARDLPFVADAGQGLMEYRHADFRKYLNRVYEPTAYFILFSSLFIIVVFPVFFKRNLDQPLQELLAGVRQIQNGKLSTNIPVFYRDEIGFLAKSFNEMAIAQNNILQSLEDKVAERTAEASAYAADNARLEERNHLSQELHDAVSQTLFSANLIADTLPALIKKDPESGNRAVAEIQQLNREALGEMRQLLTALRYQKLSGDTLGKLLQDLIEDIQRVYPIEIELEIESDTVLPQPVQVTFFRIAQETLNNSAKHSGGAPVEVSFDGLDTQALLMVRDFGCGFDPEEVQPGHHGLEIMRERMASIGGTLEIESAPGKGTVVTAIWMNEDER